MAAIAAAVVFIPSAFAVHDTGAFELDGNATNGAIAGDDWDNVCHQIVGSDCSTSSDTNGATAASWASDGSLNATIFTGGGSKDPQDINNWAWKDGAGGLPDKDNLLHSFAAQYSLPSTGQNTGGCPNGVADQTVNCDVLFFGSDRYDNSGDAQQGFWFFQNKIGLGSNSIGGGSGFSSSGSGATPPSWHKDGDVLVISDFSNGGGTSTITVYKWDHTCLKGVNNPNPGQCGDANLRLLSTSTNANCGSSNLQTNDNACGIVNGSTITMPWSFTDKSKTPNNGALNGEFFEAGINLSTLGLSTECFATVLSETRSSTSTTATLKDFVLGGFGSCGSSLDTTPTSDGAIGDDGTATVSDSATLTVTGLSSPPAPTGTAEFYLCGPSDGIQSCDDTGTDEGAVDWNTADTSVPKKYTINSGDQTVTSAGDYCWFVTWAGDTNYPDGASHDGANECFTIAPRSPALTTSATAGPVSPGDEISDTATFTTSPAGPSNGTFGTITFSAYGPDDATCSDTPAYTSTITINGTDTSYNSADGDGGAFTDTSPGTYLWVAQYDPASGDNNNVTASTSCGDDGETSQVQQLQPTMDTAQNFVPNDSATITVDSGGGDLAGSVVFKLYVDDNTCTDPAAYMSDPIDITTGSGNGLSQTVVSDNATAYDSDHTFYWVVTYTSSNNGHKDVSSPCTNETSSITIDNGSQQSS